MMHNKVIYTIGHSTHEQDAFLSLLTKNSISCVVDVRSVPFSQRVPHFNKEVLREYLENHGIVYLHFPKAFGARQKVPELLSENGRVDFEKVRQTGNFREGMGKLQRCTEQGLTVALMCSEANPLDCHRFGMISYQLARENFSVWHILKDGNVIDNEELERRLVAKYFPQLDGESLFQSTNKDVGSLINLAYKLRNKEIGYLARQASPKSKSSSQISAKVEGFLPFLSEPEAKDVSAESSESSGSNSKGAPLRLYTIGFTNKPARKFFELLETHNVKKIIDTRANNVSQLSGFAKGVDLEFFAKAIGDIDYSHELFFAPTKDLLEKYRKKRITWDEYAAEYSNLLVQRRVEERVDVDQLNNACLLCSEHLPDRCHRRLLADYIKDKYPEIEIIHLK